MPPSSSIARSTADSTGRGDFIHRRKKDTGPRIRLDDLPFGQGGGRRWRQEYIPNLIAWAGSQHDPFVVNLSVRDEMIRIWERVFPACALRDSDKDNLAKMVRCFMQELYDTF
jgi:hypothetical protein